MQHTPPLHPLQEKPQELANDSPRELRAYNWKSIYGTIIPLFKVDETLRYEVATSSYALNHDENRPGLQFLTLHYRSREVSKDV